MRVPVFDPSALQEALDLAAEIYRRHEAGQPYAEEIQRLSATTGQELTKNDVHGAFGSIASDDWARDLLLLSSPMPDDLSREELVEMLERILAVADPEWLQHWCIRCVEHATGCPDLIEIIYYPQDYFGDDEHDDMAPAEILDVAMKGPRRVLVTPPPRKPS